jgi:ferric-dicitrate binding protein FerR (iron transport regulator)
MDKIDEEAIEWIVRTDEADGSPEVWAALDVWLVRSAAHRAAFRQISALWKETKDVLLEERRVRASPSRSGQTTQE